MPNLYGDPTKPADQIQPDFDYTTEEGTKAFRDWYGKQQGGSRPEDMQRWGIGGEWGEKSGDTLKRWDPYLQRTGAQAGKYRSSRGAEGYFDKPTECPPGMMPGGSSEDSPCVPNERGGGRGGGGGGGGGGRGGRGGDDDLALYRLKKVYADALADPSGQQAWKLFAGQGGAAGFQQTIDQARSRIAGMPAGPARDAAEARLQEMQSGMQLQMPQAATQSALAGLSGVMQPEIGYVTSERDRSLQRMLGMENIGLQRELGMGQLGLARSAQDWEQGTRFPWEQSEALAGREFQERMAKQQGRQANKSALWGTAGQIGSQIISKLPWEKWFSDIRVKENIAPGRRGLSEILKLKTYRYNYKADPVKTPQQGVMAQDLEKVAPELVSEVAGIKTVNPYGLLSMSIEAIKELSEKLGKREGRS